MELRQDIQLLRGLAVLLVVLFHLNFSFFKNGFLGVDAFFVISGYLMAMLYDRGSALDFYKRRIDRLFPAYALTIVLTLVVGAFVLIPVDFKQLFEQALAGSIFTSNFLYWSQNGYFNKSAFNPLLNLWSLGVEVQFYLIVPLLYPLIRKRKWLFWLVFLGSMAACFVVQMVSPKTSFFMMPLRVWEFLIGAWVAWQVADAGQKQGQGQGIWGNSTVQMGLLAALCVFPFLIDLKPDATGTIALGHPAIPALVVTVLTGLVIKAGLPAFLLQSLPGRLLARIGDYSYSIYLVHFPIIVLVNYVPFGGTRLSPESWEALALIVAAIVVFSLLSYYLVEKKYARVFRNFFSRSVLLFLMIGAAFGLSFLNIQKYAEQDKNIFAALTDRDVYRCGKIFRITNPSDMACKLNDGGGENILLLGNSHADSIKKVFASVAQEKGFSTYFTVANDPFLNPKFNADWVFGWMREHAIRTVFIHFDYKAYRRERVQQEVAKLVELAGKNGIKIVFLSPIPTYETSVPKMLFDDAAREMAFATDFSTHRRVAREYRELVSAVDAPHVAVYDTALLLCPAGRRCLVATKEMKPLYFDTDHLTLTGAEVLRPLFEEALGDLRQAR